jgi:hypothetical protein
MLLLEEIGQPIEELIKFALLVMISKIMLKID